MLPGSVPPFREPIVPGIDYLHFDAGLVSRDVRVGFYAGSHSVSFIVHIRDLVDVAKPDDVFHFAKLGATSANEDLYSVAEHEWLQTPSQFEEGTVGFDQRELQTAAPVIDEQALDQDFASPDYEPASASS